METKKVRVKTFWHNSQVENFGAGVVNMKITSLLKDAHDVHLPNGKNHKDKSEINIEWAANTAD